MNDLGPLEPTRLCPDCEAVIRRKDEQAGKCPNCGYRLVGLTPPRWATEAVDSNENRK